MENGLYCRLSNATSGAGAFQGYKIGYEPERLVVILQGMSISDLPVPWRFSESLGLTVRFADKPDFCVVPVRRWTAPILREASLIGSCHAKVTFCYSTLPLETRVSLSFDDWWDSAQIHPAKGW